ncbi:CocE/NonD family hydrolase [Sphaerisporangium fuscum]|uniref:CocE/NonD family hydrolase n=1 Tax=Sphaerisporangium fuscum TaxID=2835868 RepID=UPI001BDBB61A|nr:CocE/NonD family hydrolase [Sphaerisporangium fuscum]
MRNEQESDVRPGRRERVVDRMLSRRLGLRAATSEYTINRRVRIPMRDGVELLADHYAPVGGSVGTVMIRSPYGWEGLNSALYRAQFPTRGYHLLLVRCRGTFGSAGVWNPWVHEIDDGADTLAWLRTRPWFGGKLATVGNSYLGWTQWALLMDPPPELAAAVIQTAPHDFGDAAYFGGAFNLSDWLGWSEQLVRQERIGGMRAIVRMATAGRRQAPAMSWLPLSQAADVLCDGEAPWFGNWASVRDLSDPFWAPMQLGRALDRVRVPVLLQSGWQDIFLPQTRQQYARLRERGQDVALTIGPWTHRQTGTQGMSMLAQETMDWLDEHVAGVRRDVRPARVRMFVTGAGTWRDLPDWPEYPMDLSLYPASGGVLGARRPPDGTPPARFTYDPASPTPTVGGRLLAPGGGYRDDSALADRGDVLAFTGASLAEELEVIGTPWVELAHSSDTPHADVFVRLSEVDAKGRSHNVSDGFVRLGPRQADGVVRIELDPIAHRFRAGHRIRLLVAGGSHPRWERNLGTGEDPATSTRLVSSHHTIDLTRSRLHLPVQDRTGQPL